MQFGSCMTGRNNRSTARQHPGQLRREHEILCILALRQQMYVCHAKQFSKPVKGLKRKEVRSQEAGTSRLQLRLDDAVAAYDKYDVLSRGQTPGHRGYGHQPLLPPSVPEYSTTTASSAIPSWDR